MQRLSYHFVKYVGKLADIHAIVWRGSQVWLPWFLLCALVQGLIQVRRTDVLHAGDPLVAPVVWLLARLYRKPAVVSVHGLDLTFGFPGYQMLIPWLLRRFTRVVCISRATYLEALNRGLLPERCRIIYPGMDIPEHIPSRAEARAYLEARLGVPLSKRQVWLTVGRLVPRKGVAWFCEKVLPELRVAGNFIYLVAGDGPEAPRLRNLVTELGLAEYVRLLGRVDDAELTFLYTGADAFIMPNIPQLYDHEGFGLVAIEAAAHGLPVIAARLEGIQDAVIEGTSGYLLPPQNVEAWMNCLRRCLVESQILERLRFCAREAVSARFRWDNIAECYLAVFREALAEQG
jgi:glycosyltransferase involved in cell wall biosynthesis